MLLRSLRRWSQQKYIFFHFSTTFTTLWLWKRNNDFLPIPNTFTTPWFWQKIIFLLLLLLRSLRYDYDKKTPKLSWEKYCSIVSLRKFSVSKRFVHDTIVSPSVISVKSLSIFFLGKFSVFKRFVHDTLVSSSGTSVESYMLYYPRFYSFQVLMRLCNVKIPLRKKRNHICEIIKGFL